MGEIKEISDKIKFHVHNLIEAPPVIIEAAEIAISMVWEKNVGEPTETTLYFAERIVDGKGHDTGRSSAYNPGPNSFDFALYTMKERIKLNASDDVIMLLIAAHEAKHMVQIHKGENTRILRQNEHIDEAYKNDPFEIDAWEEALHVLKKMYPKANGQPIFNGRLYEVPAVSKY